MDDYIIIGNIIYKKEKILKVEKNEDGIIVMHELGVDKIETEQTLEEILKKLR